MIWLNISIVFAETDFCCFLVFIYLFFWIVQFASGVCIKLQTFLIKFSLTETPSVLVDSFKQRLCSNAEENNVCV